MFRFRFNAFVCLAAISAMALATACKKEGGGGGGGSAAASAALDYMPAGTKMVFGFNLSKIANAKVLEKYRAMMEKEMPEDAKKALAACGIDIFKDIGAVIVGIDHKQKGVAVATGNFKRDTLEKCAKEQAEKEGKKFVVKEDGKLRVYSDGTDADVMYAYWPSDNTVALSGGELGGADVLKGVLGGGKLGDGEVMSMVKATDRGAGFWGAGTIDPSMTGGMPVGGDMKGFAMTVDASDAVDFKVLVHFGSEEAATQAHTQIKALLPMAKGQAPPPLHPLIDKLKLAADGKAVKVGISLTGEDIEKLAGLAQMF